MPLVAYIGRGLVRLNIDRFVIALAATVALASLLPCQGAAANCFHALGIFAIASLFFLQGARLSREAVVAGMTNWRLHCTIASTTFVLFPIIGAVLTGSVAPRAEPDIDDGPAFLVRTSIHRAVVDRTHLDRPGQRGWRGLRRHSV